MAYNKFMKKDGTVMLSLLEDTVTAETLQQGVTAHNRSGEAVTGTLDPDASLNAYASELAAIVGDSTQTPSDVAQELNYLLETANRTTGVIESTLAATVDNLVDGYGANGVVVGKRKFIESPTVPATYITQQINYTVIDNNKLATYTQMGAGSVDGESRIAYGSTVYTSTGGWQDENLKIIDFGETPQTVLGEFAQFIANNTEDVDERIIEVATETEMNELFPLAENGTVFKYVGETGTYENGALYIVEEEDTDVTITLNGDSISGDLQTAHVKFGSAPASGADYDYSVAAMAHGTNANDGSGDVASRTITVSNKAYVWGYKYQLNDGDILTAGATYSEATEISLANGDVLAIYAANDS